MTDDRIGVPEGSKPWGEVVSVRRPTLSGALTEAAKRAGYAFKTFELNALSDEKVFIEMTIVKADQDE